MTLKDRILQHVKRHRGIASLERVAQAWGVRPHAVSQAMRSLRTAGKIRYLLHEHITLLVEVELVEEDEEAAVEPPAPPVIATDNPEALELACRPAPVANLVTAPARGWRGESLLRLTEHPRQKPVVEPRQAGWTAPKNLVEPPGELSPDEELRLLRIVSFYAQKRREEGDVEQADTQEQPS